MSVLAIGVSYRRAPIELLERLSFGTDEYPKAYRSLMELESVKESVILSTCNRVEVFAEVTTYHAGFLDLKRFLSHSREVPSGDFADALYSHYEDDAAEHLFAVAAGIDSMVLGEPQILTQVRQAYRLATAEGATGPVLSRLFRGAITAGRRARAETRIGASPAAFVEAGAKLAERFLGDLKGRSVVVVGAGGMAGLAVKHLTERGVGRVRIVNRSVERAATLAALTGTEPRGLDSLARAMTEADMVVSSTGAAGTVIGPDAVREALANGRSERALFILDLAVPRDVDPDVGGLPHVRLVDIDDLGEVLASAAPDPVAPNEVEKVRAVVAEEVLSFAEWRRAARLAPLFQALRDRGARVQAAELARAANRLAGLSDREREAVEALARGIVAKLLHDPIVNIKERSGPGSADALAKAAAELFGIEFHPAEGLRSRASISNPTRAPSSGDEPRVLWLSQSDDLFSEAEKVIPGGVNSPVRAFRAVGGTPRFVHRGRGAYLEEVDGRKYVDYVQSWGALLFGHAREEIVQAAVEAARRGSSFGAPTEAEVRLAQRIVAAVPGVDKVRLVSSGTEAAMSAVRLARGVTGRPRIVKFEGCYHGHSDGLLAQAGSGMAAFGLPGSLGVTGGAASDTMVLTYNDLDGVRAAFEADGDTIAGVILEPVAANMGVVPPTPGFLEGLQEQCEAHGAILIFDEVITGFRLGAGGAQALYGVTPDLTCLGKVMGGGFPCAAFGGRRDLMEHLAPVGPVYQAGTLSGNPVAVAAGLATLDLIELLDPFPILMKRAQRLADGLAESFEQAGVLVTINRVESLFSVFFAEGPVSNFLEAKASDHERYAKFFHAMLGEGIHLPPSGYEGWFLSAAHGDSEIEKTLEVAARAAAKLA